MTVGVMFKTVSEACNLACDYCYYSRVGGDPRHARTIPLPLLERFMRDYMSHVQGSATFAWQGGEPLLAGIEFFEQVVKLEAQYAPDHTILSNGLQTNGILLNERWVEFFQQYRFLLGVSVDGPEAIHDQRRVDRGNQGSFKRVMRGIDYLRRSHVEFNILTVVHRNNVKRARELFEFYRSEGFDWIQLIPAMDFLAQEPDRPGVYEITAQEYGEFLCETFDLWYNGGTPSVSVRFFDNVLQRYLGLEPEQCTLQELCPPTLVVEQNGDVYPCDFFLNKEWCLGNIATDCLDVLLHSEAYARFRQLKPALPSQCRDCQWRAVCQGGCPRNRVDRFEDTPSADYFCEAYQMFFAHAHSRMDQLRRRLATRHAPGTTQPIILVE